MEGFSSTKFWLTVGIIVLTFVLVVINKAGVELWEEVCLIALGVFTAGNVASKFAPVVK